MEYFKSRPGPGAYETDAPAEQPNFPWFSEEDELNAPLEEAPAPPRSSALTSLGYSVGAVGDPVMGDIERLGVEPYIRPEPVTADARVVVDLGSLDVAGFDELPGGYVKAWLDDPVNQRTVATRPGLNLDIRSMRDAGMSDEDIFKEVVVLEERTPAQLTREGVEKGFGVGGASYWGGRLAAAGADALSKAVLASPAGKTSTVAKLLQKPIVKAGSWIVGTLGGAFAGDAAVRRIAGPENYWSVEGGRGREFVEGGKTVGAGLPYVATPFVFKKGFDMGAQVILDSAAAQNSRALRITGKSFRGVEKLLTKMGERAGAAPGTAIVGETSANIAAGWGGGLSEGTFPGQVMPRMAAEAAAALASPPSLIINGGATLWRGLKKMGRSLSAQGRLTNAGAKFLELVEEAGLDPDEDFIRALQEDPNLINTLAVDLLGIDAQDLDPAVYLSQDAGILLNNVRQVLAKDLGQTYAANVTGGMKRDLILMQAVVDKLTESKDPEILAAAAALQKSLYESELDSLQALSTSQAMLAVDRLRPGRAQQGQRATHLLLEGDPAEVVGRATKEARDIGAKAAQILKDSVTRGRDRWTANAEKLYSAKAIDKSIPVLPQNVIDTLSKIDDSAWPTIPFPPSVRRTVDRLFPGRLDTSPEIKVAEESLAKVRLKANTSRQTIAAHDRNIADAQKVVNTKTTLVGKNTAAFNSLQEGGSPFLPDAKRLLNLGLAQSEWLGKRTGVKPPKTGVQEGSFQRNDRDGNVIPEDWRAGSKDSNSALANSAAEEAGQKLEDILARGFGETKDRHALEKAAKALDKIAEEARFGRGQFSDQVIWANTPGWQSDGKAIKQAVVKLAESRAKLLRSQQGLFTAQKALNAPVPTKVTNAQAKLLSQEAEMAELDDYLVGLQNPPIGPLETITLGDVMNIASSIGKHARKFANDPTRNQDLFHLGELADAARADMDALVESGPNAAAGISRKAVDAVRRANAYWRAGNDVHLRAYGMGDLRFSRNRFGGALPIEVYAARLETGKPEETELILASIQNAALDVADDTTGGKPSVLVPSGDDLVPIETLSNAERQRLVGTLGAAQNTLLRVALARIVDPEDGRIRPDLLARFRNENYAAIKAFPQLEADLRRVNTTEAALAAVLNEDSVISKALAQSNTLIDWNGFGSNPGQYIQQLMGPPGKRAGNAKANFEKALDNVLAQNNPDLTEAVKHSVLDSMFMYGGGQGGLEGLSFKRMKDYMSKPLSRGTDSSSPIKIMKDKGLINDAEQLRLFKLLDDGIKIENLIAGKTPDPVVLSAIDPKDINLKRGTRGKLLDTTSVIDNPGIFANLTMRLFGARAGIRAGKAMGKIPGLGGAAESSLIAAHYGSKTMQQLAQDTPLIAYKDLIFRAMSDKDLFLSMIKAGKTPREKFQISRNFNSALISLGLRPIRPEAEDEYSDEHGESVGSYPRSTLRKELFPGGVQRKEDYEDPFLRERPVPRSTRDASDIRGLDYVPPPPTPTVVPTPPPQSSLPVSPAPGPLTSAAPVAGAAPSPQRQQLATLFPFDIIAGPIRAAATTPQQAAYGGPVKRKRPGILGLA